MKPKISHLIGGQGMGLTKNRLLPPEKIALIQSSRIVDNFLAVPPKPRLIDQPFIIGVYGRFCFQKGFDILIDAVNQLSNRLIPPRNPVALAKAIQELVDLPAAELAQMGEQGKASAINAWDSYISNWQQLLEAVT
ncbi:glycosyltransferase [Nostoc sp. UHCC 0870]|uniref:glycosyltransferase n=1 Tax=Nostoc sp. UHCC 0870 TaxID=2914041 RepID=UPI001EE051FA|nr:hypothetical protein [Nostoc sp. UHCC 0870]UKP00317.1 hypothetical protein L6494_11725 [Nostoc sp. UHCC 0870]